MLDRRKESKKSWNRFRYFIFGTRVDYGRVIFGDVLNYDNVHYYSSYDTVLDRIKSDRIKKLYDVSRLSYFNNRIIKLKNLWFHLLFEHEYIDSNKGAYNVFIFCDTNVHAYNLEFIEYIKKKIKNSVLVMLFINPFSNRSEIAKKYDYEYYQENFDFVFSSDIFDVEQYHMYKILTGPYSKLSPVTISKTKSDVLFVGADKGRGEEIVKIYERLTAKGVLCDFTLVGSKDPSKLPKEINTKTIPYDTVIKKVNSTKVILEMVADHSRMPSLRMDEAIVYNKHLVTNNNTVVNNPYYNKDYIHIFDTLSDIIDIDISALPEPDFNYNNDFSPTFFLKRIEEMIDRKAK